MRVVFVFNAEFSKSSIPHQELVYFPWGEFPQVGNPWFTWILQLTEVGACRLCRTLNTISHIILLHLIIDYGIHLILPF